MKHYSETITLDPQKRFGQPCVRGLRITVYDVLSWLANGMSKEDITKDYPEITFDDIQACLSFAAEREHKTRIAS